MRRSNRATGTPTKQRRTLSLAVLAAVVLLGACGSSATTSDSVPASTDHTAKSQMPALAAGWAERDVIFSTPIGTFHGTLTHPVDGEPAASAALIIGGSGPTDRDGNNAAVPGEIGSLAAVARWLATDGVASLRYDKLGSGTTGMADLTPATLATLTFEDYLTINAHALTSLASEAEVDPAHISIVGHSEGALFAMLLASGQHGTASDVPGVEAIALLQPQSLPILDIVTKQITGQVDDALTGGQIASDEAAELLASLEGAVASVRQGEAPASDLPASIAPLFDPSSVEYLRTADAIDPRAVAADLPSTLTVLVSCSDADTQVDCIDVTALTRAAQTASEDVTLLRLDDMAHSLKVDTSRSPINYVADLPFSPELRGALTTWVQTCC